MTEAPGKSSAAGAGSLKLLQKLAASKRKREAAREAERQCREAAVGTPGAGPSTGAATEAPTGPALDDALEDLAALQNKLGLSTSASDYLDGEQVLFPASPAEPGPPVDTAFSAAATEALQALGMQEAALDSIFDDGKDAFLAETFRQAVLSGAVALRAAAAGECSGDTISAVFALMSGTEDLELAGAACRTLFQLLDEASSLADAGLDAGCWFGNSTALGAPGTSGNGVYIAPEALFTAENILEALRANGYDPERAAAGEVEPPASQQAQQITEGVRVHTIKLLVHVTAALARHCARRADSATAIAAVLPTAAAADLLVALLHMGLDPAALRLQRDLDIAAEALLVALPESEWASALPELARCLAALGPGARARLRLLRQIPSGDSAGRGRQLQRFAGCVLVESIISGPLAPKSSAISKRVLDVPDPTDVLLAQPWFRNPKGLAAGAAAGDPSSSAVKSKKEGSDAVSYTISDVELLLHLCDVLLWPAALRALQERRVAAPVGMDLEFGSQDPDAPIEASAEDAERMTLEFHASLQSFLMGLHRSIKRLQPEDMAVKALASRLSFRYKEAVEGRPGDLLLGS